MKTKIISLNKLLPNLQLKHINVAGFSFNLQDIKTDFVFVAVVSKNNNRENNIDKAVANGASVILKQATGNEKHYKLNTAICLEVNNIMQTLGQMLQGFYPHLSLNIHGVTGTNGKTSFCWLLASMLETLDTACGFIGTLGLGRINTLKNIGMTTPDILTLYPALANFADNNCQQAALEVSAHSIVQNRIAGLNFASKVFTNLSQDHLDYFATLADYASSKCDWISQNNTSGLIFINIDDEIGNRLFNKIKQFKNHNIFSFSLINAKADIYADNVELYAQGIKANVYGNWGKLTINLKFFGSYNLLNIMPVIGILFKQGFSVKQIAEAANNITLPAGRMQMQLLKNGVLAIVDYAHTPDALKNLLIEIKKHTKNKIALVFGCGGDRDTSKRAKMGEVADKYADFIWLTNDNPRHEKPENILNDIAQGFKNINNLHQQSDRKKAIYNAIDYANKYQNITVVVAGKGHENTQQIGDDFYDFSDIQTLQNYANNEK